MNYNKLIHQTDFVLPVDLKRLDFIADFLFRNLPPKSSILEIGCGAGNISAHLALLNFCITGIDIDPQSIHYAKKRFQTDNLEFLESNMNDFMQTHHKTDSVICSEVLEHLDNPEKMIDNVYQVLPSGGFFVVTVPNGFGPREILVTRPMIWINKNLPVFSKLVNKLKKALGYKGTVQSKAEYLEHIQFFTRKKIFQLLRNHGFSLVKFGKTNFIEETFPVSLLTNRIMKLKEWDCMIADKLPAWFSSGFNMIWVKK